LESSLNNKTTESNIKITLERNEICNRNEFSLSKYPSIPKSNVHNDMMIKDKKTKVETIGESLCGTILRGKNLI